MLYIIAPLEGPVNGVKILSNEIVKEFQKLKEIKIEIIDTAQAVSHQDFGKFSFDKIKFQKTVFKKLNTIKEEDFVYMNFSPKGFAFYRDYLILSYLLSKSKNVTIHLHANGLEKKRKFFLQNKFKNLNCIVITENQYNKIDFLDKKTVLQNTLNDYYNGSFLKKNIQEQIQILFFSNLSKEKGTELLFEFCQSSTQTKQEFKIIICGGTLDDFSKDKIQQIKELNNSNIQILDPITNLDEKMKLFKNSHFFLFLSNDFYEVYPLVYIEALMNGVSVITTKQYVANEIISDDTGTFFHDSKQVINFIDKQKAQLKSLSFLNRTKFEKKYNFEHYFVKLKRIILNES